MTDIDNDDQGHRVSPALTRRRRVPGAGLGVVGRSEATGHVPPRPRLRSRRAPEVGPLPARRPASRPGAGADILPRRLLGYRPQGHSGFHGLGASPRRRPSWLRPVTDWPQAPSTRSKWTIAGTPSAGSMRTWRHTAATPTASSVGGHSAGGHLAALVTLQTGRLSDFNLPADVIKGCLPVSGVFDVTDAPPDRQEALLSSPDDAVEASPLHNTAGQHRSLFPGDRGGRLPQPARPTRGDGGEAKGGGRPGRRDGTDGTQSLRH